MTRFFCVALVMLAACWSGSAPSPPAPQAAASDAPPARILVLGDIQLASEFKETPSLSTWRRSKLDTAMLAARLGEALRDTEPTHLLHTGDLVDLNEAAVLEVRDHSGALLERSKQGFQEWQPVLSLFPERPVLFPAVGNHERYGELVVSATLQPDGDRLELQKIDLTKELDAREVHAQMLARFPHLERLVEFHGRSGSYHAAFPRFCLLSLDGADFDHDPTLIEFVEKKLGKCATLGVPAIVLNHYPIFSGRARQDDVELELRAHRDRLIDTFGRHHVALVINGHEHFYLRYLDEGRARAGYGADLPKRPIYMTVSDLTNPYSRSLKRTDAAQAPDGLRYFRGTHYALVEVTDGGVDVTVRGYRREKSAWEMIDSFRVPP